MLLRDWSWLGALETEAYVRPGGSAHYDCVAGTPGRPAERSR